MNIAKKRKSIYNNGKASVPETNDTKELSLAIKEWSEGDEILEDTIKTCFDNGVQTFASCRGHGIYQDGYLAVIINKENSNRILSIMNEVTREKRFDISLDYFSSNDEHNPNLATLSIYGKWPFRNKMFNTIRESVQNEKELKDTDRLVQDLWNINRAAEEDDVRNYFYYRKGILKTEIDILLEKSNGRLEKILREIGDPTDSSGNWKFWSLRGRIDLFLRSFAAKVKNNYKDIENKNDEEKSKKENFKENLLVDIDEKRIDTEEKNKKIIKEKIENENENEIVE